MEKQIFFKLDNDLLSIRTIELVNRQQGTRRLEQ